MEKEKRWRRGEYAVTQICHYQDAALHTHIHTDINSIFFSLYFPLVMYSHNVAMLFMHSHADKSR